MGATSAARISRRAGILFAGAVLLAGGAFIILRPREVDDRATVAGLLTAKYGKIEANRRMAEYDALVAKKSEVGQSALWRRTLDDLLVSPARRQAIFQEKRAVYRAQERAKLRARVASYLLLTKPPRSLLELAYGEACKLFPKESRYSPNPRVLFYGRYPDGLTVTLNYGTPAPQPRTSFAAVNPNDLRNPILIAREGKETLPVTLSFDFTLTRLRDRATATKRLGLDTRGERPIKDMGSLAYYLPRLPVGLRGVSVNQGDGLITGVYIQGALPKEMRPKGPPPRSTDVKEKKT